MQKPSAGTIVSGSLQVVPVPPPVPPAPLPPLPLEPPPPLEPPLLPEPPLPPEPPAPPLEVVSAVVLGCPAEPPWLDELPADDDVADSDSNGGDGRRARFA
jgi:hypothetical protein